MSLWLNKNRPSKRGNTIPNKQTNYGRAPNVYLIGRRGRSYLADRGEMVTKRYRKREDRLHKGDPINHTLAVGDALIHAKHLEYYIPDIWLEEYSHEWELNANPYRVAVPYEDGQKIERLAPDSIFRFDDAARNRLILLEIYRTPIDEKRWKRKVRTYVHAWPIFKQQFGVRDLQIAVINGRESDFPKLVTEKRDEAQDLLEARQQHRRHRNMLRWTAEEMEQLGYADHADIFYFSTIRHNRVSFQEFWFSPHWTIPLSDKQKPLIHGKEGQS